MPELPEVETTRRGLAPHLVGSRVVAMKVRNPALRWPVPAELPGRISGKRVTRLLRRGKYLLADVGDGGLLMHLGMSGSMRLVAAEQPAGKHDHIDLLLDTGMVLRFCDPRRFGCFLWVPPDQLESGTHKLLVGLGPEPLSAAFDGAYLKNRSRGRRVAVKPFIMDSSVVVGVGNIYATEALFHAGIRPDRAAGRISRARYDRLAEAIQAVLARAIRRGGTTLRDYVNGSGAPGYFSQELDAYGRAGEPCRVCGSEMIGQVLGQRSTVYCKSCQR